ncbi:MAG: hypothetical protein GTN71_06800 [Anaerolineae bacterium]|nr:hypothetical protein [Anaerolineae bacterium]
MKTTFNRKIGAIKASVLGTVLLVIALVSCTPQPMPAVTEPLPTASLVAAPTATATPRPTPVIPEDWLVFCDPEAGCTFSYPADADFKAGKSKFGIYTIRLQFRMPDVIGYQGMVIHVVPITDSSSMDDILAQLYESSPQELSLDEWLAQLEPTTVGSQTGFKTACAEGSSDFSIVIPHENKVYIAAPVHDIAATCVDPQALDLFYRVLETFIVDEELAD